jgi:Ubiquitin-2 like Rad60 SUMO-like
LVLGVSAVSGPPVFKIIRILMGSDDDSSCASSKAGGGGGGGGSDSSDFEGMLRKARETKRREQQQQKRLSSAPGAASATKASAAASATKSAPPGSNKRKASASKREGIDSDDDDDDSEDDSSTDDSDASSGSSVEVPGASAAAASKGGGRIKGRKRSMETQLAAFQQQRALEDRKRYLGRASRRRRNRASGNGADSDSTDSSDSGEEDDRKNRGLQKGFRDPNAIAIDMDCVADDDKVTNNNNNAKSKQEKNVEQNAKVGSGLTANSKEVVSIDDSSSSEDEEEDAGAGTNDGRESTNAQSSLLAELAVAAATLQASSGPVDAADPGSGSDEVIDLTSSAPSSTAAAGAPRRTRSQAAQHPASSTTAAVAARQLQQQQRQQRQEMTKNFYADFAHMQAMGYPASAIAVTLQQKYSAAVLAAIAGVAVSASGSAASAASPARARKPPRATGTPARAKAGTAAQKIQVKVVSELIEPGTTSSKDDATSSATATTTTTLSVDETDKLSALAAKLLEALGVPAGGGIVTFKSESQTLYLKHTAKDCNLTNGCTLHAKVHLISSLLSASNASSPTVDKKKLGRSLSIQLRRSSGETIKVKTYQKQPFRAVMDEFVRHANGPSASSHAKLSCKFKFDGELLDLKNDTPEGLDMDDDDLIDVVEA